MGDVAGGRDEDVPFNVVSEGAESRIGFGVRIENGEEVLVESVDCPAD